MLANKDNHETIDKPINCIIKSLNYLESISHQNVFFVVGQAIEETVQKHNTINSITIFWEM